MSTTQIPAIFTLMLVLGASVALPEAPLECEMPLAAFSPCIAWSMTYDAGVRYDALDWFPAYWAWSGNEELDHAALSANGKMLVTAGQEYVRNGSTTEQHVVLLGIDAQTGEVVWNASWRDGLTLFGGLLLSEACGSAIWAGTAQASFLDTDVGLAAFDVETGVLVWEDRFDRGWGSREVGGDAVLSADGRTLYVGGWTSDVGRGLDHFFAAYDACSGKQLWWRGYGTTESDSIYSVALSPDGARLYASGSQARAFTVLALDSSTGALLWQHLDPGEGGPLTAYALAVDPSGHWILAAGDMNAPQGHGPHVVALNAATGAELWRAQQTIAGAAFTGLVLSPDAQRAYASSRAGTASYGTHDGGLAWWIEERGGLAAAPDGTLYVGRTVTRAATQQDCVMGAHEGATGALVWQAVYHGPAVGAEGHPFGPSSGDWCGRPHLDPLGRHVYAVGRTYGVETSQDALVVAFHAAGPAP